MAGYKDRVLRLFSDGQLQAMVDSKQFCGVEAVADAVDYMLSAQAIGKVVVKMVQ